MKYIILGLSSCIAALLGAQVVLTDLPDRLRLLKKNVETNLRHEVRGSAAVKELTWGDDPDNDLVEPPPDYGNKVPLFLPNCKIYAVKLQLFSLITKIRDAEVLFHDYGIKEWICWL